MKPAVWRTLEAAAGIAAVAAAIVWLSGGFGARVPPGVAEVQDVARPPNAQEAIVEQRVGALAEWASGALASARQTIVASRILARIEDVRVRAGDRVVAGDVLVVLDSREIQARVAQAAEALQAARARLDLAQSEKTRYEQLFEKGVTTQQRLDQVLADVRTAHADVDRLEQSRREAETGLSYTEIRAPVPGLVVDRLAEPGDTASPGSPLLRIYDPSALRVEVPVRESLAVRLRVGDALSVEVPALADDFQGRIEEIVPFAEPGARTLLVKVALPQDPRLYAGLFARVAIPAGTRTRLLVPEAAIERVGQLSFVMAIEKTNRLERRVVTLGEYRESGKIEVLSGLAAGERVIYAAGVAN
jgi:membrane fusion protein (multidrug efflux system)